MTFEYAPALESRAIVTIKPKYGHFINGAFVSGKKHFPTINPATEEILSHLSLGSASDIDKAVAAAQKAYTKTWSKLSGKERGKYLYRIARILQERAREFAVLETLDNGKPIRETRDIDIPLVAAHFFYHAGWADKLDYAGMGKSPQPHGVAGQIIPWNFPLLMLAWKVAPALATGNTVVLKPAETTSLTALLFAEVCQQAELPDGVVNIVTGDGSTGSAIVNHAGIHKIAFTGSTEVGKKIARAIAGTNKKATLELGGKGANIVFDDAPIDETVEGIVNGIFFNQGHVCCAGSRLILQEGIADEITEKLKARMSKIRVGDPLDKNTDIGAINSKAQLEKIKELAASGSAEGGEAWSPKCEMPKNGFWFAPTIFTGVTQSHRIAREEIFGPVLSVLEFEDVDDAIDIANSTIYGLSSGIWTKNIDDAIKFAKNVRSGTVWVNCWMDGFPEMSFGGFGESGIGRELGRHAIEEFTELKTITIRTGERKNWLS